MTKRGEPPTYWAASWSTNGVVWRSLAKLAMSLMVTMGVALDAPAMDADLTLLAGSQTALPLTRLSADEPPIEVDGHLNESIWQQAPAIEAFRVLEPDTLEPGEYPTFLRLVYTDKGLYVGADMRQPPDTLVRRLTGRDQRGDRDSINITLDTSGEGRYGFWFGVALGDSLMDGTVLPERQFSNDWDGPWDARTQVTAQGWTAEMFIPWSAVSMPATAGARRMGLYASRMVASKGERWGFPALPSTQSKFMSALQPIGLEAVQPRQQYNFYPFTAASYDGVDGRVRYRAGADLFWRPSSNFQLNATLNPDFGNVESDEVVINLSATETFYPEQRLFFLEGQEIFTATPRADRGGRGVGRTSNPYTMVNTRRIGGKPRAPDLPDGASVSQRDLVQQSELAAAVKTTGQLGRLRYGVLGASEDDVTFDVVTATQQQQHLTEGGNDYGIARVLYENSVAGDYRALGLLSTAVLNDAGDAVVHGFDWHYLSADGMVKIDGQYMMSDVDDVQEKGYGGFLDFELTYRQGFKQRIGLEYFDENIDINDLGYLERNNHYQIRSALEWTTSRLRWAQSNQFDIRGFYRHSVTENGVYGAALFLSDRLVLNDLSQIVARLGVFPAQYDDLNSFGNGTFKTEDRLSLGLRWRTDSARRWSWGLNTSLDQEMVDGVRRGFGGSISWHPNDQVNIDLALEYVTRDGWLLHQKEGLFASFDAEQWMPRVSIEYFLTARQQLRLSFQYVGIKARERDFYQVPAQPGDLLPVSKPSGAGARERYDFAVSQYAFQARYRWEIAPLSDIFFVYTRQADLRTALDQETFDELFNDAWQQPLQDILVFKIRYRFGS